MKKLTLTLLVAIVAVSVAMAASIPQAPLGTTDILGAHLNYGRGCVGCHAPHSGSAGNGVTPAKGDPYNGSYILWGQDLSPLYGQVFTFASNSYTVTLPADGSLSSNSDPATIVLLCLSCHDGNLSKTGMTKGVTVETLPVVGGNAPTWLGNDGSAPGNYLNDHPVGPNAIVTCGGSYNWDCTGGNTTNLVMNGPNSSIFANTNYGFGVSFGKVGSTVTAVMCTSCHNQHSQNIYKGTMGGASGYYQTMFFLKGYYNPSTNGNNAAQFCRQCHGGESNEMNGQTTVPTT